jgi:hypothetical protein
VFGFLLNVLGGITPVQAVTGVAGVGAVGGILGSFGGPSSGPYAPSREIDESSMGCSDATMAFAGVKDTVAQTAFSAGYAKAKASMGTSENASGFISPEAVTAAVEDSNSGEVANSGEGANNSGEEANNSGEEANNSGDNDMVQQEAIEETQEGMIEDIQEGGQPVENNSSSNNSENNPQVLANNSAENPETLANNSAENPETPANNSAETEAEAEANNDSTNLRMPRTFGVSNSQVLPELDLADAQPTSAQMMVGKPVIYTRSSSYQNGMNGADGFNQCWENAFTGTWTPNFIKGYKSYKSSVGVGAIPLLGQSNNSDISGATTTYATTTYVTTTYDDDVEPDLGEVDEDGNPVYPDTRSVEPTEDDDQEEALQRAQLESHSF